MNTREDDEFQQFQWDFPGWDITRDSYGMTACRTKDGETRTGTTRKILQSHLEQADFTDTLNEIRSRNSPQLVPVQSPA